MGKFRAHRQTAQLMRYLSQAKESLQTLDRCAICAEGLTAYIDGVCAIDNAVALLTDDVPTGRDVDLLETIICDQPVAAQQRDEIARAAREANRERKESGPCQGTP